IGVGTHTNTTSASATAAAEPTTNDNRPAANPSATNSANPGSANRTRPRDNSATLPASTSLHTTRCPSDAKHAPVVNPTYPVPTTTIRRANRFISSSHDSVEQSQHGRTAVGAGRQQSFDAVGVHRVVVPGDADALVELQALEQAGHVHTRCLADFGELGEVAAVRQPEAVARRPDQVCAGDVGVEHVAGELSVNRADPARCPLLVGADDHQRRVQE